MSPVTPEEKVAESESTADQRAVALRGAAAGAGRLADLKVVAKKVLQLRMAHCPKSLE